MRPYNLCICNIDIRYLYLDFKLATIFFINTETDLSRHTRYSIRNEINPVLKKMKYIKIYKRYKNYNMHYNI